MVATPAGLPRSDCLIAAVTTPVTASFRPDGDRLARRCEALIADGCDGVALFGTTGEGAEFSLADRQEGLERVIAGPLDPGRIIVSIGAMNIPDIVALAHHALDRAVAGLLLMPPCVYRSGVTEEGTFHFFRTVIDRIARDDPRLYLYHFPDICGAPVTHNVIRRLDERYPGSIAGVKDSGGDLGFTESLLRRFSHLSILTGTEIHLPQALTLGARGTICGLANVMARLVRNMIDARFPIEQRRFIPAILSGDCILSRHSFIASLKALIADATGDADWRRVVPPMAALPMAEEKRMIQDFRRWEAALPVQSRSLYRAESTAAPKVVTLRRG